MKFQHAPGLPGYGTVGVDGSDGLLGISTYFCEYDATTTVQVTPKIAGDYKLQEGADVPLADGRIYQTGDMFIDTNGKAYEIDLSLTDLYVYSNSRLNTSTIFVDAGVTTNDPPAYERYANAHWPDKFLIDTVYTNAALANYTLSPGSGGDSIYGTTAKDFARINYVDVSLNNYYPYELFGNTVSNEPEKAIALVKEYGRNTWRLGNLDNTGGVRDVSLYLDFADIYTGILIATSFTGAGTGLTGIAVDLSVGTATHATSATSATNATNATNISVNNENSDATCYPLFFKSTGGTDRAHTSTMLKYSSVDGALDASYYQGNPGGLDGHAAQMSIGGNAGTATTTTKIILANEAADTDCFPVFAKISNGDVSLYTRSGFFQYNSNTNTVTATTFSGSLSGSCTGTAGNVTGTVAVNHGGTGLSTIYAGGILRGHVTGNVSADGNLTFDGTNLDINGYIKAGNATGHRFKIQGGSEYWRMSNNGDFHAEGNVIAYSSTVSDIRLKENIKPLESSLDKIIALRGVKYDRKRNKDHHIGLIAQEVEKIIPEVIYKTELLGEDGIYKTINYIELIPYLVESIKEQQKMIKDLKKEIINIKQK